MKEKTLLQKDLLLHGVPEVPRPCLDEFGRRQSGGRESRRRRLGGEVPMAESFRRRESLLRFVPVTPSPGGDESLRPTVSESRR